MTMRKFKKKSKKVLFSVIILIAVFVVLLLVRTFSEEDTWLCRNGKWERHGNPSAGMPERPCR